MSSGHGSTSSLGELSTELVRLLADGRFHSGEALGRRLGVSRAAVWKRLRELEALGLSPERVRGKGYRLPGGLELLERERIAAAAGPALDRYRLVLLDSTGSTNTAALEAFQSGDGMPVVTLAEHQHAGRGRRGRGWHSPYGCNLYLSLARAFESASRLEGLSLAVGLAVAETLESHGLGDRVGLKWPNDIYCGGRKLGGILVELAGDLDADCTAVIGIGINGRMAAEAESRIDQPWTDLARESDTPVARNRLAGQLIDRLSEVLDTFLVQGFAGLHARWERHDCCAGRRVQLQSGEHRVEGVARGVDERGALLLESEGRVAPWHGGEVSLRLDGTR